MTENGVNITELHTYIVPSIVIRDRNDNYTDLIDGSKRYITPMRKCRETDFTSRNIEVSK